MPPAFHIRLPRRDAVCDLNAIYMDREVIASRPAGLDQETWAEFCLFVCGERPKVAEMTFPANEGGPEVWSRLDKYMQGIDDAVAWGSQMAPTFRRRK